MINFNGKIESKSSFRFELVYIMRTKNKEQERLKMRKSRGKVDKTRTKRKEGIRCRAGKDSCVLICLNRNSVGDM